MLGWGMAANSDVLHGIFSDKHPLYQAKPECCMTKGELEKWEQSRDAFYAGEYGSDNHDLHPEWWAKYWGNKWEVKPNG